VLGLFKNKGSGFLFNLVARCGQLYFFSASTARSQLGAGLANPNCFKLFNKETGVYA
jgi:hypothetical protein